MSQSMLHNPAAERAVLSGICSHGIDAFVDVDGIVESDSFVIEENQIIYKCLKKVFEESSVIDISSVLAAANDLGFGENFKDKEAVEHLRGVYNFPIELENVRNHAVKIRKLQLARDIQRQVKIVHANISDITGDESVNEIISIAEAPIMELSHAFNRSDDDKPNKIGSEIEEYIAHLEENPTEMVGISSGYARYDEAIGGGFRRKCVDLVAARPKVGKSVFAENVALHVSGKLKIPVLMLDTEMSKEDHLNRILANLSDTSINDISTGSFAENDCVRSKVKEAASEVQDIPYDYISIAGRSFEETLSIMRRWIFQKVGFDKNGRVNDCLIVYDYLKLMSSGQISDSLREFQVLGFQMTSLHNFCVQYDCPCLSFVQLNRDGITRETTDVVSGSDRLIWLCTSFSIFKNKSIEEVAEDGDDNGNKKLVPIICRHGPALSDTDYINMTMYGEQAKLIEGKTRNEVKLKTKEKDEGFIVNDDIESQAEEDTDQSLERLSEIIDEGIK